MLMTQVVVGLLLQSNQDELDKEELWVERCSPTKLEYNMHLELLQQLEGQLFLFHGTAWNRVQVCRYN